MIEFVVRTLGCVPPDQYQDRLDLRVNADPELAELQEQAEEACTLVPHVRFKADIKLAVNVPRLRRYLDEGNAQVLHFAGHGLTSVVVPELSNGVVVVPLLFTTRSASSAYNIEIFDAEALVREIQLRVSASRAPFLFVVMGCETAAFCHELVAALPWAWAIGWHTKLHDRACAAFTRHFYSSLFGDVARSLRDDGCVRSSILWHAYNLTLAAMRTEFFTLADPAFQDHSEREPFSNGYVRAAPRAAGIPVLFAGAEAARAPFLPGLDPESVRLRFESAGERHAGGGHGRRAWPPAAAPVHPPPPFASAAGRAPREGVAPPPAPTQAQAAAGPGAGSTDGDCSTADARSGSPHSHAMPNFSVDTRYGDGATPVNIGAQSSGGSSSSGGGGALTHVAAGSSAAPSAVQSPTPSVTRASSEAGAPPPASSAAGGAQRQHVAAGGAVDAGAPAAYRGFPTAPSDGDDYEDDDYDDADDSVAWPADHGGARFGAAPRGGLGSLARSGLLRLLLPNGGYAYTGGVDDPDSQLAANLRQSLLGGGAGSRAAASSSSSRRDGYGALPGARDGVGGAGALPGATGQRIGAGSGHMHDLLGRIMAGGGAPSPAPRSDAGGFFSAPSAAGGGVAQQPALPLLGGGGGAAVSTLSLGAAVGSAVRATAAASGRDIDLPQFPPRAAAAADLGAGQQPDAGLFPAHNTVPHEDLEELLRLKLGDVAAERRAAAGVAEAGAALARSQLAQRSLALQSEYESLDAAALAAIAADDSAEMSELDSMMHAVREAVEAVGADLARDRGGGLPRRAAAAGPSPVAAAGAGALPADAADNKYRRNILVRESDIARVVDTAQRVLGIGDDQKLCALCATVNHVIMPVCEDCGEPFAMS